MSYVIYEITSLHKKAKERSDLNRAIVESKFVYKHNLFVFE